MLISSGVMIEFMIYANKHLIKLGTPHSVPRPMLISTLMLTIGIVLGYAYFIIFNLTFQDCDTLVDTLNPQEVSFVRELGSFLVLEKKLLGNKKRFFGRKSVFRKRDFLGKRFKNLR